MAIFSKDKNRVIICRLLKQPDTEQLIIDRFYPGESCLFRFIVTGLRVEGCTPNTQSVFAVMYLKVKNGGISGLIIKASGPVGIQFISKSYLPGVWLVSVGAGFDAIVIVRLVKFSLIVNPRVLSLFN